MKIYRAFLIFLLTFSPMYASQVLPVLDFTVKFIAIDFKKNPNTKNMPKFIFRPYAEFYGGLLFSYNALQFRFVSGVFMENDVSNIFFYNLDLQYFGDIFSFVVGKNNYVWGGGLQHRMQPPSMLIRQALNVKQVPYTTKLLSHPIYPALQNIVYYLYIFRIKTIIYYSLQKYIIYLISILKRYSCGRLSLR